MPISLGKAIMVLVVVDIVFIMAAGFSGVTLAHDELMVLRGFVVVDYDTNTTDVNESIAGNVGVSSNKTGSSVRVGITTVIFNTLFVVWNAVILLFSYILAPVAYLKALGAPLYAQLLVGGTMVMAMVLGLIQFIAGRNI